MTSSDHWIVSLPLLLFQGLGAIGFFWSPKPHQRQKKFIALGPHWHRKNLIEPAPALTLRPCSFLLAPCFFHAFPNTNFHTNVCCDLNSHNILSPSPLSEKRNSVNSPSLRSHRRLFSKVRSTLKNETWQFSFLSSFKDSPPSLTEICQPPLPSSL